MSEMALNADNCKVVYCHMEPSSERRDENIMKFAAKIEDESIVYWIKPTGPKAEAGPSGIGRVECKNFELFFRDERLPTVTLKSALMMFYAFLKSSLSSKKALLVTCSKVDKFTHLLRAILETDSLDMFHDIIAGFSDARSILEEARPRKVSRLPVPIPDSQRDEHAILSQDVLWSLQSPDESVNVIIPINELFKNSHSYEKTLLSEMEYYYTPEIIQSLAPLRSTLTIGMTKKIAEAGLSLATLNKIFHRRGSDGLTAFLSERDTNNEPRVTSSSKILNDIVLFFEEENTSHENDDHEFNRQLYRIKETGEGMDGDF